MKNANLNQAGLARHIQLDPSNVSKYLTGRLPLSDVFINRIIVAFGVTPAWLKHGDGTQHTVSTVDDETPILPLYDIDVAAGLTERSRDYTDEAVEGHVALPGFNPNWVMLRAKGDSMEPVIADGALLAILPYDESSSPTWGQIYVVVTENRRVVKYVRRHKDSAKIILKSANPDYDPMEVDCSTVVALYPVKAIVNIKICK
jgi:phage repressor protein C with HTH and peptisase S24 domain